MHGNRRTSLLAWVCAAALAPVSLAAGDPGRPPASPADSASSSVAARVGGETISLEEVDRSVASALMRIRQEQYEARQRALDALIDERVLEREATARGISKDKVLEARIEALLPKPTAAEIDAYYQQTQSRWGTRSKGEVAGEIVKTLQAPQRARARGEALRQLRRQYGVQVLLEPPRVEVPIRDDPTLGPDAAPVTIVEFSDFQCPFCGRAEDVIEQVVKKYGSRVRFVYRDFPLSIHANAETAARAGACARAQGKFWEMSRAMFAQSSKLAVPDLVAMAGEVGIDTTRFRACLDSGEYRDVVKQDVADGERCGVSGTPTFFVNGIMIVGAKEMDVFTSVIDRELERAHR